MKRTFQFLVLFFCLSIFSTMFVSASEISLYKSDTAFRIEDQIIEMPSYIIGDDRWVPVTLIADAFGFQIHYDQEQKTLNLYQKQSEMIHTQQNELFTFVTSTDRTVSKSNHVISFEGNQIPANLYFIDGYNFISAYEVGPMFGYRVFINPDENQITYTKDSLYDASESIITQFTDYLKTNGIPVDLNKSQLLDGEDLDPFQVYLLGESHGVQINYDLQLFFIKYLYERQGVRQILRETGYCNAMLENQYLATGDPSIIERILTGSKGSSAYSKDAYAFYEKVYAYNQTLPQDKKLVFIGIDVQHDADLGIAYILSLLDSKTNLPALIQTDRDLLKQATSREDVRTFAASIEKNQTIYQQTYGTDYKHLKNGINSILQLFDYSDQGMETRELSIHQNFKTAYEESMDHKFFGMLGSDHVNLVGTMGNQPCLANYLHNEYEWTKGKVCSIYVDYYQSYYMDQRTGASIPHTYTLSRTLTELMAKNHESQILLYPLTRKESPFIDSGFTNRMHYYLSVKNSPAAIPFGEI